MHVIRDVSGFAGTWLNGLVPHGVKDGSNAMAVIDDEDELIAVVAISDRTAHSATIAVAGTNPRWASRPLLEEMFTALFEELGTQRLSCLISENNARSLRLTRGLGWKEEGRIREGGSDGEDLILFGMLKRECDYLIKDDDDARLP